LVRERRESPGPNSKEPKGITLDPNICWRGSLSSSTTIFARPMSMPYLSTGPGGRLPVRFHSASGRQSRPSGRISIPRKKPMPTLIQCQPKTQKRVHRMIMIARNRETGHLKGAAIATVQPSELILVKALMMLTTTQME